MQKYAFTKLLVAACCIIGICSLYASLSYAAYNGTITDNFNGASINYRLWQPYNYDQHQRWVQKDGELRIQIDGASVGETFGAGVNSNFLLKGNFEIMVDYRLITWPSANGISVGFNNDNHFTVTSGEFVIRRISIGPNENYKAAFDNGYDFQVFLVPTADISGRLKWTRVGLVMTGYFFNKQINDWQIIGSHDYFATGIDEWVGFSLNARGNNFTGQDVEIAFDNFQVTYDQIRYTSNPAPISLLLLD
jgi:hypothetical protein